MTHAASHHDVNAIKQASARASRSTDSSASKSSGTQSLQCGNCGRRGHRTRDPSCPAMGKTCRKCGKQNHFAAKCRSQASSKSREGEPRQRSQGGKTRAYQVEEEEDETLYAFSIGARTAGNSVPARIQNAQATVQVDSGASCNLMGEDQLRDLTDRGLEVTLEPCSRRLFAYGSSTPLPLVGQFTAPTAIGDVSLPTTFIIIKGKGDILLGRKSAEAFGVLTLHYDSAYHVSHTDMSEYVQEKFPAVFKGIGKLTGYEATIHLDPAVQPVAQKPRRIPFALREKVRDHISDLLEKDIIEPVEGPSPWVSPVVVAPKPGSDNIRLCVDMRRANEAVLRERYPIPTVDEILEQLNGSTVFSKLDLKWGFHQIVLDEA